MRSGESDHIIINESENRVWGSDEDGNGPEFWTDDSQCATVYRFEEVDLPPGGKWIHWKDPRADF